MTTFSDFIRNATEEEKREVYEYVMKRASERQGYCSKCGKVITQPGVAYGINPDALCTCCRC